MLNVRIEPSNFALCKTPCTNTKNQSVDKIDSINVFRTLLLTSVHMVYTITPLFFTKLPHLTTTNMQQILERNLEFQTYSFCVTSLKSSPLVSSYFFNNSILSTGFIPSKALSVSCFLFSLYLPSAVSFISMSSSFNAKSF